MELAGACYRHGDLTREALTAFDLVGNQVGTRVGDSLSSVCSEGQT